MFLKMTKNRLTMSGSVARVPKNFAGPSATDA